MMVKSVIFHGVTYKTTRSFRKHVKSRYKELLKQDFLSKEDIQWAYDLISQRHPDAERKLRNLKGMVLRRNSFNQKQLWLQYTDRADDNVSITRVCVNGLKRSDKINKAFRCHVTSQVLDHRRSCGITQCQHCGADEKLQVDHIYPFSEIKREFLASNPNVPKLIDLGEKILFVDQEYAKRWQTYHSDHARYQMLCPSCNVYKSNKMPLTNN